MKGKKVRNLDKESEFYNQIGTVLDDDGIEPLICLVKFTPKWGDWVSSRKLEVIR